MPRSTRTPAPSRKASAGGGKVERLQQSGFLRKRGSGGAFRYATAAGERPDAQQAARIRRLAVPPAWTEIAIARSENAPLQAVGRDRAGRWQYLYHAAAVRAREEKKRKRLVEFIRALPALRAAVPRGGRGARQHPGGLPLLIREPVVLDAFERGRLPMRIRPVSLAALAREKTLSAAERALLRLLEQ